MSFPVKNVIFQGYLKGRLNGKPVHCPFVYTLCPRVQHSTSTFANGPRGRFIWSVFKPRCHSKKNPGSEQMCHVSQSQWSSPIWQLEKSKNQNISVHYNISLTWIKTIKGDDSPYQPPSMVRSQWGRYNLPRKIPQPAASCGDLHLHHAGFSNMVCWRI